VAGYPEKSVPRELDLENLKRNAAGARGHQLFYDNADFFRFREAYQRAGITAPLVPGILPVTNLSQIQRITSMCGAKLPQRFTAALAEKQDDADWQFRAGVDFAIAQFGTHASGIRPALRPQPPHATAAVLPGIEAVRHTNPKRFSPPGHSSLSSG
jgi:methylenetetrahydrofolate reductase (NADPH)